METWAASDGWRKGYSRSKREGVGEGDILDQVLGLGRKKTKGLGGR